MALMSGAMMMMYMTRGGGGAANGFLPIAMIMMVGAAGAMLLGNSMRRSGERKQKLKGARRDYLRYLTQTRRKVRKAVSDQQKSLAWRHPAPQTLWSMVGTTRMWERRPTDPDFAEARLAIGEQKLGLRLSPMSTKPVEDLEPLTAHALRSFIRAYATVPEQPTAVYLRSWARLLIRGDERPVRAMVRAMIAQLAVFHCPDDLWLALCVAPDRREEWEWVKWLPHNLNPHDSDGAGPVRMVATDFPELEGMLGAEFWERPQYDPEAQTGREEPYTLIVVDGATIPSGHPLDGPGMRNATVIDLSGALTWRPGRTTLRLTIGDGELGLVRTDRDR
jgi:S-DNA-T family DNA segregation ATPase FtsK/SpoIIIE